MVQCGCGALSLSPLFWTWKSVKFKIEKRTPDYSILAKQDINETRNSLIEG